MRSDIRDLIDGERECYGDDLDEWRATVARSVLRYDRYITEVERELQNLEDNRDAWMEEAKVLGIVEKIEGFRRDHPLMIVKFNGKKESNRD